MHPRAESAQLGAHNGGTSWSAVSFVEVLTMSQSQNSPDKEHKGTSKERKHGRRPRGKHASRKKTRAHKVIDVPKTSFIGFVTTFDYVVFNGVWTRIMEKLQSEGCVVTLP